MELLAPAGNMDGFCGAVNAGCDAVYLGGPAYGARAYADNFTEEELREVIRTAHLNGVRVYMTVNVLTRQEELADCVNMTARMYEAGLDGVIVQDLGVLSLLHQTCPGLLLHASTQLSVTMPEGARFLRRLGVSRVVPARELSLPEIHAIRAEGMEVEAFVHGAMCYSYSGRCLMSSMLGGRSGNRGRCAGTCRLPYEILDENRRPALRSRPGGAKELYPISMRDMCTLDILPELIDAGIDSFKIEGRMKKPEYAAGVTAIYRRCIDRFYEWDRQGRPGAWQISQEERREVESLYLRSALSDGYYHQRNGRNMVTMDQPGYAGTDDKLLRSLHERYVARRPQVPVSGEAVLMPGEPASLTVTCEKGRHHEAVTITTAGAIVERAEKHPLTEEEIRQRLQKTGGEAFCFRNLSVRTQGAVFLPVAGLNKLRRDAMQALEEALQDRAPKAAPDTGIPVGMDSGSEPATRDASALRASTVSDAAAAKPTAGPTVYVSVLNQEQLEGALQGGADALILDGPLVDVLASWRQNPAQAEDLMAAVHAGGNQAACYLALPSILRTSDRHWLEELLAFADGRIAGFLCRTIEEIEFLYEKGYDGRYIADSSVYRWNRESDAVLAPYCTAGVLPLELAGRELLSTFRGSLARQILPVYGRIPLMVTANCVRKSAGACRHEENGFWYLRDRKKVLFPVRTDCRHCYNIIYNSVPLSLQNAARDELLRGAGGILLAMTDEDAGRTSGLVSYYQGQDKDAGLFAAGGYTTGHYRRGAL